MGGRGVENTPRNNGPRERLNQTPEEDIYDACYGAVGLLVVPLSGILASLETDSLIKLQGTAVLRDDDDDLIVDRITPGEWAGVVLIEGAAGSPFDGTWEAHRQTP